MYRVTLLNYDIRGSREDKYQRLWAHLMSEISLYTGYYAITSIMVRTGILRRILRAWVYRYEILQYDITIPFGCYAIR